MDRGAWQATILGITKGSNMTEQLKLHFGASQVALVVKKLIFQCKGHKRCGFHSCVGNSLEEVIAIHFSIPAWRIPMDRRACLATVHRVSYSRNLACMNA